MKKPVWGIGRAVLVYAVPILIMVAHPGYLTLLVAITVMWVFHIITFHW